MASPQAASGPLVMAAAASGALEHRPLRGTYWKVIEVRGANVVVSDRANEPHLNFSTSEKRVSGSSGCNRVTGSFEHAGASLKFGPLAGTRMACLDPALDKQEQQIFTQLQLIRSHRIHGDDLSLLDAKGVVVLRLKSVLLR